MELHRKNGISVLAWFLANSCRYRCGSRSTRRCRPRPSCTTCRSCGSTSLRPTRSGRWVASCHSSCLAAQATTFIQQIMPQQMDPVQQKMMTYMLPAIFTAMMLFLPSGLGVYMLTNSVLGILQQLVVERYYASKQNGGGSGGGGGSIEVREKGSSSRTSDGNEGAVSLALGKGEAGV
ncbi:MAG: YidC/Oxa1 family membrane protein insertase [Polyangiaceae bacterium]